jgi:hypothetical protein
MPGGIRVSLILLAVTLLVVIAMTAYCFSQPAQPEPPNIPGDDGLASLRLSS